MSQIEPIAGRRNFRLPLLAGGLMAALAVSAFTGCGSIPDATIPYNLAKTEVSFKITRTVTCDSADHPIVSTAVVPTVAHSAGAAASAIELKKLRGTFSDSDVKFDFYDDGRLKGVNASSTGQGDTVLKAVTTLAGTIAAFALDGHAKTFAEQCGFIRKEGGGKPLTVTYTGPVEIKLKDVQTIPPDFGSELYASKLAPAIGTVCAVVEGISPPPIPVQYRPSADDVVLWAQQPGRATIIVSSAANGGLCVPSDPFWHDQLTVAQAGVVYPIPLPSPKLFGKEAFGIAFADSGALTSVQFTSTNGSAQALGGLNSLLTAAQGESTASKAADLKAQADLIAQQQRLTACLADPKSCK